MADDQQKGKQTEAVEEETSQAEATASEANGKAVDNGSEDQTNADATAAEDVHNERRRRYYRDTGSGSQPGSLAAGIDIENRNQIVTSLTEDSQEAMQSFLSRRPVSWKNR